VYSEKPSENKASFFIDFHTILLLMASKENADLKHYCIGFTFQTAWAGYFNEVQNSK